MCRRVDLPTVQRNGCNHQDTLVEDEPIHLRLYTTEELAMKTPFRRGEPGSDMEQGALLYVTLDDLAFQVQDNGAIFLDFHQGIEPWRIGVMKLISLGNRGERGRRIMSEEESRQRGDSQRKAWETRRARQQLADQAIPEFLS
jgi:hypothetical protein